MADAPSVEEKPKTGRSSLLLGLAIVVVLGIGAYFWFGYQAAHPSTDDAYVRANYVWISARISGKVDKLFVSENQFVKAGEPLFTIDRRPFEQNLREAEAKLTLTKFRISADNQAIKAANAVLDEQKATLELAEERYNRLMPLVKEKTLDELTGVQVTSAFMHAKAEVADAGFRLQQALMAFGDPQSQKARIDAAEAAVSLAQLNLEWTTVPAPADGFVTQFYLRVGDYVEPGDDIFPFVETSEWWVRANFKETNIGRIRAGQKAQITLDMYPGRTFNGIVESLSAGSAASFSLLPPQNTTGNFVKVTQRIPVRVRMIDLPADAPLHMGASAEVTIDLSSSK